MKRIDYYTDDSLRVIEYPEDVNRLRESIPEFRPLSNAKIQDIYREYSEDWYCAGWLNLTDSGIKEFQKWLNGEMWTGSMFDHGDCDDT